MMNDFISKKYTHRTKHIVIIAAALSHEPGLMQSKSLTDQARHPHRTIVAIAFPAILANSSAPLVGLVDTWAIGHLPDPAYLAAIGLGSVIFNFIFWAFGFLRMGTTGFIAQAVGAGKVRSTRDLNSSTILPTFTSRRWTMAQ